MDYLRLAEKLRENVPDIGGTTLTTVANQTGRMAQGIGWVADAYRDVQNRALNWRWLTSQWTFDTVANTDTYGWAAITDSRLTGLITRFARWIPLDDQGASNAKRFLTSVGIAGEAWLSYLSWYDFKKIYKFGARNLQRGPPIHFTIDPQNNLVLGPNPNDVYTCTGEYQMSGQVLTIDTDVPEMPERFHDLIWLRAMEKMATDLAADELLTRAQTEGRRMMRDLEVDQLPAITPAPPLV